MDLSIEAEQTQIADMTAAFLRGRMPVERLRNDPTDLGGRDANFWREMGEMGWFAMAIPADRGGIGYSACEEIMAFREFGRYLTSPRALFTALAVKVAAEAGHPELISVLGQGDASVALAQRVQTASAVGAFETCRVYDVDGARYALEIDGSLARIFDLPSQALTSVPSLDKSVPMAMADLDKRQLVATVENPAIILDAMLLQSAMMLGAAEACLTMIADYAKIRVTFGKPIGTYQAVRHPIADMAIRCEAAWAQLRCAALLRAHHPQDADTRLHVASARVLAEEAAVLNADANIQLHGGIGVTAEFTAHHYLKRVHTMSRWFGTRREHLATIVATLNSVL